MNPTEKLAAEASAWLAANDAAREAVADRGGRLDADREQDRLDRRAARRAARREADRLADSTVHPHTDADRAAYRQQQEHDALAERRTERARLSGFAGKPWALARTDGVILWAGDRAELHTLAAEVLRAQDGPAVLYLVRLEADGSPVRFHPDAPVHRGAAEDRLAVFAVYRRAR